MVRKRKPKADRDGWALYDDNGRLVLFDARLPVFWLKKIAAKAVRERGAGLYRIIPVRVVPSSPRKRKVKR